MKRFAGAILTAILFQGPAIVQQERSVYSIAPAKSKMEVHVFKDGFFKAFGHDHLIAAKEVSGTAELDARNIETSKVRLRVAANSLTVIDPGEPEKDRKAVQETMAGPKVLDVANYPEIVFTSTGVAAAKKVADGWDVMLTGHLKLHGVEKAITLPVHVQVAGDELQAQGETSVLQTDFGITPVRVGGGAVKVKDKIKISFTIVAVRGHS